VKKPRVHPLVQLVANEWDAAVDEKRSPNWDLFTDAHIANSCQLLREAKPEWNKNLSTLKLRGFLANVLRKKMWIPEPPTAEEIQAGAHHIYFIFLMILTVF
jgi:hypothetical protein